MADARPLRDVFTELVGVPGSTGDPAARLSDQGHDALSEDLVAEAVVSYADTAPVEVAEHLAPYVAAHSVIGAEPGDGPPAGWHDLLSTAPDVGADESAEVADHEPADVDVPAVDFGAGADVGTIDIELPDVGSGEIAAPDAPADDATWPPVEDPGFDEVELAEFADDVDDEPDDDLGV
jgi:hypothetical protein